MFENSQVRWEFLIQAVGLLRLAATVGLGSRGELVSPQNELTNPLEVAMKHLSKQFSQIVAWLQQDFARSKQSFDFKRPAVALPDRWNVPAYMCKAAATAQR
jgi:hypothetical protein